MLPLTTTVLCNHDKITLRAETQMRMMKHKGDESVKSLPKKKKKRKKERKIYKTAFQFLFHGQFIFLLYKSI